ncbi:extracellular solute-binding protein [Paenibacillus abyssi]|uniref:ABC transporter substrate-binding protein n=1 Tax=Paenibacillus abyssi TaxID=1340531 RepID=A0A917G2Y7_9BACL|nr:extracellular solute-binding protein [Paenibacillus abyssi]GGG19205.1 ABC transporter substrate-binding protein [Paenibacillus abyssi]
MKWNAKKTLAILLTVMMIVVAGCSSGGGNNLSQAGNTGAGQETAKPEKLTMIVDTTFAPFIERIGAAFEQEHGVKVEFITTDYNSLHDKVVTSLAGGNANVDIVLVDTVWTAEFATAGFIEPLNSYVEEGLKDQIVPISYDQRVIDDNLYALPVSNEGKFLYYNEKMLKDGGYDAPPQTWDELNAIAKDLKAQGIAKYGIVWGWTQAEGLICDYTLLVESFGGQFQDEEGNWVFNEGGALEALEFMVNSLNDKDFTDPSSLSLNDGTVLNAYAAGGIPFMMNWSFAVNALKDNPDIKLAFIPGVEGKSESATVTGGGALGIAATSKNKDWAWNLIDFINEKRSEIIVNDYIGSLPVWKDLVDNEELLAKYPDLGMMTEQFDYAVNRPNIAGYSEWSHIMQFAVTSALVGEKTPKQALDDAKQEIDSKEIK